MDKQQPQDVLGVKQIWSEIIRRKLMVASIVIIGVAISYGYTMMQPVLYSSTASLLIESFIPSAAQVFNPYGDVGVSPDVIKANRSLSESRPVRERARDLAREKLGDKADSSHLDMVAHSDGQILYLQILDTDPNRAAVWANAWSTAFVTELTLRAKKKVDDLGKEYEKKVPERLKAWKDSETQLADIAKNNNFNAKDYDLNQIFDKLRPVGLSLETKKTMLNDLQAEYDFLTVPKRPITYEDLKAVPSAKDDTDLNLAKQDLQLCRTQLREAREKYEETHPDVVAKVKRVEDAQKELNDASNRFIERLGSQIKIFDAQLKGLQGAYNKLEEQKNKLTAIWVQWDLQKQLVEENKRAYDEIKHSQENTEFTKQTNRAFATQWEDAIEPLQPFLPSWKRNLAAGGMLSVMFAILAVISLDKLDDTVRTPKDLQRKPGLNSLGMIPASDTTLSDADAYAVVQRRSFSLVAEALRNLHIGLEVKYGAHRSTGQPLVVTVTSSLANEGKSMVSSNLALLFSGLGRKVLIVDADLRKRSLSRAYKCEDKPGLRDIIQGAPWSQSLVVPAGSNGLFLLPAGNARQGDVSDTIQPESFVRALDQIKPGFDVVIFDTPPVLPMADACIMGQVSDVTILIVRSRRTSLRQVETAISNLTAANVKEIGCVVNGVDDDDASAGAYIYGYGYGYGYGLEPDKHRENGASRERSAHSRSREKVRE